MRGFPHGAAIVSISPVQDIVADMRAGKMVILVDEEDRENEGDLVLAADYVTPEAINFMVTHARGLVCLTLSEERCRQLDLPLMVRNNRTPHGTAFTVSIEAAEGVTTGISAHDRARTVRVAVAKHAQPADIVQPGHIFPLMAQKGGVLVRAGHTEAGCDLTQLAGLTPAACESVRAPRVAGSPVVFECKLYDIIEIGNHHWVMGEVVRTHVDERVYLGQYKGLDHRIDSMKVESLRPVGRLGRANYVRIRDIETVLRADGPND